MCSTYRIISAVLVYLWYSVFTVYKPFHPAYWCVLYIIILVYCKFPDIAAFPQLWNPLRWRSLDLARAIFLRAQGEHRTDDERRSALFFLHGHVGLVVCPEVPSCCGAGAGLGWDGLDLILLDFEWCWIWLVIFCHSSVWLVECCSLSVKAKVNTYPDFHGKPRLANVVGMPRTGRDLKRSKEKCRWADLFASQLPSGRGKNSQCIDRVWKSLWPRLPRSDSSETWRAWLVAIPNQHTLRTVDSAAGWWWFPAGLLLLGKRLRWTFTTIYEHGPGVVCSLG